MDLDKTLTQRILKYLPFGLMVANFNGTISFLNERLADIFEYRHQDFDNLSQWLNVAFPDVEPRQKQTLLRLDEIRRLSPGKTFTHTATLSFAAKKDRILGFTQVSLDNDDFLLICTDLTEQKRIDAQMEHAHKMEAIASLAGSVAHDVNNLLMGIQGYATLMLMDASPSDPYFEKLKGIETQIQNGTDLTEQLLEYARGGRFELKTIEINDVLSSLSASFTRSRKEIKMTERYSTYIWSVEADINQIEHVFQTIFIQMAQCVPGGGAFNLATENVMLDDSRSALLGVRSGPYAHITLTATPAPSGFFHHQSPKPAAEPSRNSRLAISPLNLSTIQGIVSGHSGAIEVVSDAYGAFSVHIFLPASPRTPHKVISKPTPRKHPKGQETILLVDDERVITEVTGAMITQLGYNVLTASDGEESVEIYQNHFQDIDLVIMDVVMPGMGGGEAIEIMREINPSVRVILSSGYSMSGAIKAIMDKGVSIFLKKPYRIDDFSKKIRDALDG